VPTLIGPAPGASPDELPLVEYRTAPRHRILQRCFVLTPEAQGAEGFRSIAHNISVAGIGLALPLPLKEGIILEIKPWGLPAAPPLRARVVHVKPVAFLWFCGCELITRLSEKELQAWRMGPRNWLPEEQPDPRWL
jgi:hypothetical protein